MVVPDLRKPIAGARSVEHFRRRIFCFGRERNYINFAPADSGETRFMSAAD